MNIIALWNIGGMVLVAAAAWGSIHYEVRMLARALQDHETRIRSLEHRFWEKGK